MKTFLIWSEEHHKWWGPGGMGYTDSIFAAGRYDEAEAYTIADDANRYLRPGQPLKEIVVLDPCASRSGRTAPGTFVLSPTPAEDGTEV